MGYGKTGIRDPLHFRPQCMPPPVKGFPIQISNKITPVYANICAGKNQSVHFGNEQHF